MVKKLFATLMVLAAALLFSLQSVQAQDDDELTFSMSRDFGYASGTGQIQGTFSMRVEGPENLVRVVFLIDGQPIGEDSQAPFRLQFSTDTYEPGIHSLGAVGYTQDGRQLQTPERRLEFVTAEEGTRAALAIVIPIFSLVIILTLASYGIPFLLHRKKSTPLGTPRNYGLVGGTICPKCQRPFAMNIMGFNLLVGKLDRCPHCGKWSLVRRVPLEILRAAEIAEKANAQTPGASLNGLTEEEKLKKALEDSRYRDI